MLRVQSEDGWWLITHPEHARLAGAFASHWGNEAFASPQPRAEVLDAIYAHDDGWAERDARPSITRQGKPSAFSQELVGKYSAFEEIDLREYLSVRESALDQVARRSAYAALLVSMHTSNLLTERADRSTIKPDQLPLLDNFLARLAQRQESLREEMALESHLSEADVSENGILQNFRLLQATDQLSLLSCVSYSNPATLLHPMLTIDGHLEQIMALPIVPRTFRLQPYPLDEPVLSFDLTARHVNGEFFATSEELQSKYLEGTVEKLKVTIVS